MIKVDNWILGNFVRNNFELFSVELRLVIKFLELQLNYLSEGQLPRNY